MILVKVNHQIHQLEDRSSYPLSEALSVFIPDLPDKGIAVALNGQVVRRPQWASTLLVDQDSILIITATQGG